MGRGHQTDTQTHTRTSRLLDQLGPEGRVGENCKDLCLEILKVHQKTEKDQEFQYDECEYKCSKRDTQEP